MIRQPLQFMMMIIIFVIVMNKNINQAAVTIGELVFPWTLGEKHFLLESSAWFDHHHYCKNDHIVIVVDDDDDGLDHDVGDWLFDISDSSSSPRTLQPPIW